MLKAVARDTGGSGPGLGSFSAANQILGFGGRLTLSTGVPVMTATVAGATTVRYTPYAGSQSGNRIAIYDGTLLQPYAFTELSNVLANSAVGNAGPAAAAVSSVYDLYVWNNGGTLTLTRSPAWASATTRGTGAGTAEQDAITVPGVVTNKVAITNGPAANRGTFVGTIATNAAGTVDWQYGGSAAGGTPGILNVWNQYNRLPVFTAVQDSGASWAYSSATIRAANASNAARVTFVCGAVESAAKASYLSEVIGAVGVFPNVQVGLDSTTAGAQQYVNNINIAGHLPLQAVYVGYPGLGSHFFQALESGGAAISFIGAGLSALIVELWQ